MKVKELIEELKKYDGELKVVVFKEHDGHYGREEVDGVSTIWIENKAIEITSDGKFIDFD